MGWKKNRAGIYVETKNDLFIDDFTLEMNGGDGDEEIYLEIRKFSSQSDRWHDTISIKYQKLTTIAGNYSGKISNHSGIDWGAIYMPRGRYYIGFDFADSTQAEIYVSEGTTPFTGFDYDYIKILGSIDVFPTSTHIENDNDNIFTGVNALNTKDYYYIFMIAISVPYPDKIKSISAFADQLGINIDDPQAAVHLKHKEWDGKTLRVDVGENVDGAVEIYDVPNAKSVFNLAVSALGKHTYKLSGDVEIEDSIKTPRHIQEVEDPAGGGCLLSTATIQGNIDGGRYVFPFDTLAVMQAIEPPIPDESLIYIKGFQVRIDDQFAHSNDIFSRMIPIIRIRDENYIYQEFNYINYFTEAGLLNSVNQKRHYWVNPNDIDNMTYPHGCQLALKPVEEYDIVSGAATATLIFERFIEMEDN